MALSNRDRISKALEVLNPPLVKYVEIQLRSHLGTDWAYQVKSRVTGLREDPDGTLLFDTYYALRTLEQFWKDVFGKSLDMTHRSWVFEMINVRNRFAHDEAFSSDETRRALDTIQLFLEAISASDHAQAVKKIAYDLLRTVFSEESRSRVRQAPKADSQPQAGLKPWRDVVTPHPDVSSGNYQKAEFAADLAQVYRGDAALEYQDPKEFYRRTHLTQGLSDLLKNAIKRLCTDSGDPVIELQTNFGGGKTHSMLALYHLVASKTPAELPGVEPILQELNQTRFPAIHRAVLVGTAFSPGQPETKPDGCIVKTLWGEMAWQLGNSVGKGKEAFAYVADSDNFGTAPGSQALSTLLEAFSPSLILIDEWVAFIRQTYGAQVQLPCGSFDANLTFAQNLTEAVKSSDKTLLVASLPVSNLETGGEGGKKALDSLKHTFNRVQSSWRPANSEESYEIIRRRLFEPLSGEEHVHRDTVINAFIRLYKDSPNDFPSGCKEQSYKHRMESCYPIHPELFERLYKDWSALEKFQQTRGVLRLMATVIHSLWEQGDRNLLILPSSIPMDDRNVCDSLTYYLEDGWKGVIDKDIDGLNSLPLQIDQDNPTLGRYSAARRVARSIFMGSAPIEQSTNAGLDTKHINLGCVQPGESVASFGDTAIRRLEERATYLYQEARRYWFSTQPSVDQLARERASALDEEQLLEKLTPFLKEEAKPRQRGEHFDSVHVVCPPYSDDDIPDEKEVRLVILGPSFAWNKNTETPPANTKAQEILDKRGSAPRLYKNMLVFLAPDQSKVDDVFEAVRQLIAWQSIVNEADRLDLKSSQRSYVDNKRQEAEGTLLLRIQEAWMWCLFPHQSLDALNRIEWNALKLPVQQEPMAQRVGRKLTSEEHLMGTYSAPRLKLDMERFNLWQGRPHLEIRQLWDYFCQYPYLPRLKNQRCLLKAIETVFEGHMLLDKFGYAEGINSTTENYVGLIAEAGQPFSASLNGLIVHPDSAQNALEKRRAKSQPVAPHLATSSISTPFKPESKNDGSSDSVEPITPESSVPKRFFASAHLDEHRVGRDAGRIAEGVVQHLADIPGAKVEVRMEIQVSVPDGVPDYVIQTVTENCETLKMPTHGFV